MTVSPNTSVNTGVGVSQFVGISGGTGVSDAGTGSLPDVAAPCPMLWYDDGDGSGGYNPNAATGGEATLTWTIPRTYTTAKNGDSRLFLSHFIVDWDISSGGPYANQIDTSTLDDPSAPRVDVSGFAGDVTVYYTVKAVDHAGVESAASSELSVAASLPSTPTDPTPGTIIGQADLPYTISSSGVYRVDGSTTFDTSGQAAITISADDVILYKNDLSQDTFASTNPGQFIAISGSRDNIEIYGFNILHGGYIPTGGTVNEDIVGIFLTNSSSCTNLNIHNNTVTHGVVNGNSESSGSFGCIVGENSDWTGEIHENVINVRGTNVSAIRGISGGDSTDGMRIHNNTINYGDTATPVKGYQRLIVGGAEIDTNTFNGADTNFDQVGVIGINPNNDAFVHGNTFNADNTTASRYIMLEENKSDVYVLYNDITVNDGDLDTSGNRGVRIRFGASGHVLGYNTMTGTGTTNADDTQSVLFDVYGQELPTYGPPTDCVMYGNTATGIRRGLFHCQEIAQDFYTFENTSSGGYLWFLLKSYRYNSQDGWSLVC